jgi:hypothetical protein
MLTARQIYAYADFFARLPSAIAFIAMTTFLTEYLILRGFP